MRASFRSLHAFLLVGLPLTSAWPCVAWAAKVKGRATFGGYSAVERFKSQDGGSETSDARVISSRLYLKATEIGERRWEFTSDLRDKHDFFDKADKEKLTLTEKNEFQARELNARYPAGRYSLLAGRFSVQEAGAAGVDGALVGVDHSDEWRSQFFGGKNPKRSDQTYFQFNPNSNIAGASLTFQKGESGWERNFYLTHGLVNESENSETDRFYLFHNGLYQWREACRILSLAYVDFVPRVFLQSGSFIWQQRHNERVSTDLGLLLIDSIAYLRVQDVRETLPASPYRELSGRLDYSVDERLTFLTWVLAGQRDRDGLNKSEASVGVEQTRFGPSRNWDALARAGARKNFLSDDLFARLSIGYFTRVWEFGTDLDIASERYTDGTSKKPFSIEFNAGRPISRSLFATLAFQNISDETVQILSAFFKISYRFGTTDVAPLRDGAPPRGRL